VEVLTHRPEDVLTADYCPLYDRAARGCLVYPVRPLVCRLLGFVEWMPCPLGRDLPVLADGPRLMVEYARLRPEPVGVWLERMPLVGRPGA
jgi:Fe-S-cluster containining protein